MPILFNQLLVQSTGSYSTSILYIIYSINKTISSPRMHLIPLNAGITSKLCYHYVTRSILLSSSSKLKVHLPTLHFWNSDKSYNYDSKYLKWTKAGIVICITLYDRASPVCQTIILISNRQSVIHLQSCLFQQIQFSCTEWWTWAAQYPGSIITLG